MKPFEFSSKSANNKVAQTPTKKVKTTINLKNQRLLSIDKSALKDSKHNVPISQLKHYDKILEINKPKIVEYALKQVKGKIDFKIKYDKVKEIDYSKLIY